ncbi:DNA polymerase ligase N-terminal domain-containing protein [Streptomyces sulphureus]|uniref:DNA polymerase ligase N-terminal domain-containing protein n=1 Tax=Streptomyces sulphureus TaxID=47758 RepID=UPI000382CE05|nr:DNA polymerase ligase N-terminal domain-containing protein [Streptomyces sulphureus]
MPAGRCGRNLEGSIRREADVSKYRTLETYRSKRHFDETTEPSGEDGHRSTENGNAFVVQIHDATTLHFDVRLEADGVLKSWSVPKGPPAEPGDRRLAMPTEDHPLAYREFEGVIPHGEYGAGSVIVWDEGSYRVLSHDRQGRAKGLAQALDEGHVTVRLSGAKLRGDWSLVRFRGEDGSGDREAWLMLKRGRAAAPSASPDPIRARSALSGRTLKQVARSAE